MPEMITSFHDRDLGSNPSGHLGGYGAMAARLNIISTLVTS